MKYWLINGKPQTYGVALLVRPKGSILDQFAYFREKVGKPELFYDKGDLSIPAGHIERSEGERPRAAAVRELKEETNMVVDPYRLIQLGTYIFVKRDCTLVHITVFQGQVPLEQWDNRFEEVELHSPGDLIYQKLRITMIYPALILKHGQARRVQLQQVLAKNPLPSPCAIHTEPPIYIDGPVGKFA